MTFLSRNRASKQPITSDDMSAVPTDEWEAALHRDKHKKKRISGVILGAALCCLPGATLGAFYDDWRASKEAPQMEARARERELNRPTTSRASQLPWGDETWAIMGERSIADVAAEANVCAAAKPVPTPPRAAANVVVTPGFPAAASA